MEIKLPAELERYVRERVESGAHASADEAIAEAVTVWRNVLEALPGANEDLGREIDLGLKDIAKGRVSDWDVEEAKAELRRLVKGT